MSPYLKPGNIFLDSAFRAKIGDFGLALEKRQKENHLGGWAQRRISGAKSDTGHSNAAGTPLYIAPECISSGKNVSSKVDMYSLGVIMFEMFYKMEEGRERLQGEGDYYPG